ncbi:hypothetical protein AB0F88_19390 [Streptosporangium sp. NPDC023963]|uniref:hypothetical protein n=1 Tax=Streptosporangium sp. NPDC023963 TaxID=3155608 RepID=UPI00341BDEA5
MWHDSYVLVVLAFAAVAVIAGVTVVAMGRGGELSEFAPDVPPLNLPQAGQLGAVDFMALQLPVSLVGYNTQSVDETLNRVAGALSERDTRIAVLEQRVSELLAGRLQARHELNPGSPPPQRGLEAPYEFPAGDGFGAAEELSNGSPAEREPEGSGEPSGPEKAPKATGTAGTAEGGTSSGVSPFARPSEPAEPLEPAEPSGSSEPFGSSEPEKLLETAETAGTAEAAAPSDLSRFARPSEPSDPSSVPDSPSSPSSSGASGASGASDSGTSDSKESSPGSVGLRTGERQETEDPR